MRYLRDLGIDAHLFMYETEQELFLPENDTYYIDRYQDYIHILPVKTSVKGLLFLKIEKIKKILDEYDFFIGCGIAPAIFLRLGIRLDIVANAFLQFTGLYLTALELFSVHYCEAFTINFRRSRFTMYLKQHCHLRQWRRALHERDHRCYSSSYLRALVEQL